MIRYDIVKSAETQILARDAHMFHNIVVAPRARKDMKVAHRITWLAGSLLKAAAGTANPRRRLVGLSHPIFSRLTETDANRNNSVETGTSSHIETDQDVTWPEDGIITS